MNIILITFLGIITRILFFTSQGTSDEYSHIWMMKAIKKKNKLFIDNVEKSIINGYRGYPPFPHFIIVKLFPEKYWKVSGKIINILYDIISIIIFYLITLFISHEYKISNLGPLNFEDLTTLLFAVSPILHPTTARLLGIGGRTFGNTLSLIYFTLLGFYLIEHQYVFLFICIPLFWLIVISSQFATQVIFFFSFFVSIIYLNPFPMITVIISILFSFIIPRLGIKKLLQRKIDHYYWFFSGMKRLNEVSKKNSLKDILLLPYYLFTDIKKFIKCIFWSITPLIIMYSIPPVLFLIYWAISDNTIINTFLNDDLLFYLSSLSISTIIIFIITSLKPFLFLGEAERYFEYSVGAIYILFVFYTSMYNPSIIYWFVIYNIIIILINYIFLNNSKILDITRAKEDDNYNNLISCLSKIKNMKLISIPTKWNFKIASSINTNDAVFYYDHISNYYKIDGLKYMRDDFAFLYFIKPDIDSFKRKYKVNTLAVKKNDLLYANKLGINYNFNKYKILFENNDYAVYHL